MMNTCPDEISSAVSRGELKSNFFFSFITLGLELSDTNVHKPYIRALLGTASHYCEAVVLEPHSD